MRIIDLPSEREELIEQAARLLVEGFAELAPNAWKTLADAQKEVREMLGADRLVRIAMDEQERVLGWVGAIAAYDFAWELHPLVVHPHHQRQGIGRALVADIEAQIQQRGAVTIFLGTDDETNQTSLSGVNLYENLWQHIAAIENRGIHPFSFYQKLGYSIVGVIPDANGMGKPDILMAKRLEKESW